MTITNAELSRINAPSGTLTIQGGTIFVNGVSSFNARVVDLIADGFFNLSAVGRDIFAGKVLFRGASSTFPGLNVIANEGVIIRTSLTSGPLNIIANADFKFFGSLEVGGFINQNIRSQGMDITTNDLFFFGSLFSNSDITIRTTQFDASIGLDGGSTTPGFPSSICGIGGCSMTITDDELSRINAPFGTLTIQGGSISVDGVSSFSTPKVALVSKGFGQVTFRGESTFPALDVFSDFGVVIEDAFTSPGPLNINTSQLVVVGGGIFTRDDGYYGLCLVDPRGKIGIVFRYHHQNKELGHL